MTTLADGTTLKIHRNGAGYIVEQTREDGLVINSIECDNMAEARAAMHYGPDRW